MARRQRHVCSGRRLAESLSLDCGNYCGAAVRGAPTCLALPGRATAFIRIRGLETQVLVNRGVALPVAPSTAAHST